MGMAGASQNTKTVCTTIPHFDPHQNPATNFRTRTPKTLATIGYNIAPFENSQAISYQPLGTCSYNVPVRFLKELPLRLRACSG